MRNVKVWREGGKWCVLVVRASTRVNRFLTFWGLSKEKEVQLEEFLTIRFCLRFSAKVFSGFFRVHTPLRGKLFFEQCLMFNV